MKNNYLYASLFFLLLAVITIIIWVGISQKWSMPERSSTSRFLPQIERELQQLNAKQRSDLKEKIIEYFE